MQYKATFSALFVGKFDSEKSHPEVKRTSQLWTEVQLSEIRKKNITSLEVSVAILGKAKK